jgi:hypothetical protein
MFTVHEQRTQGATMSDRPLSKRVREQCICPVGGFDQCGYCDDADEIAKLEAERDRLELALCKYGTHDWECPARDYGDCNCGLTQAKHRAALEEGGEDD